MKVFTIESETNNITVHDTVQVAEGMANAERFDDEVGLSMLASGWPMARLAEIWNSLPGETSVKKFKDRATAISRIWTAIQHFGEAEVPESEQFLTEANVSATVAQQVAHAAPEAATSGKKTTWVKKAPKEPKDASPRAESKTAQVIDMLKRGGGTTVEEITNATGWQKHTTRAMLSAGGSLTKNHGLVIISEKVGDKRVYSIKG